MNVRRSVSTLFFMYIVILVGQYAKVVVSAENHKKKIPPGATLASGGFESTVRLSNLNLPNIHY